MASSRIVPVIMCGGAGTRLWPVSRESMPKQFVPLVGPDSTFQQVLAAHRRPRTVRRSRSSSPTPISASWSPSSCASAASRPTSCSNRCGATPAPPSRSRPAWRRCAIRMPSCWCSRPTTSSASPTSSATPAGRPRAPPRKGQIVTFGIAADPSGDQLRLHPSGRPAQRHRGARGRRPSSRSPMQRPPPATWRIAISGTAAISCFMPRPCWREIERFEPEMAEAAKEAVAGHHARSRFPAARRRAVRARAEEVHRLCRDGAHPARRRGSRRSRLVGRRQLERGLGCARPRPATATRSKVPSS